MSEEGKPEQGPETTPEESPEQSLESLRAELAGLKQRMEEIRAATEEEVLKKWTSPWKGAETVKAKVEARLASNAEFREIMTQARTSEALQANLDRDHPDPEQTQGGHPAVR